MMVARSRFLGCLKAIVFCIGLVSLLVLGLLSVGLYVNRGDGARTLMYRALGPIVSASMMTEAPAPGCWYHQIEYRRERSPVAMVFQVFEFDPHRISIGLVGGDRRLRSVTELQGQHTLVINANYFDEDGKAVMMARHGSTVISGRAGGISAFFWQHRDGQVGITHYSNFRDGPQYNLVVQSVPRLMAGGRPTSGLRDTETMALRTGVGVLPNGHVIFYSTGTQTLAHGLSYDELRSLLSDHLQVESLLILDGGASVQFAFTAGEVEIVDSGWREVPVFLTVDLR